MESNWKWCSYVAEVSNLLVTQRLDKNLSKMQSSFTLYRITLEQIVHNIQFSVRTVFIKINLFLTLRLLKWSSTFNKFSVQISAIPSTQVVTIIQCSLSHKKNLSSLPKRATLVQLKFRDVVFGDMILQGLLLWSYGITKLLKANKMVNV